MCLTAVFLLHFGQKKDAWLPLKTTGMEVCLPGALQQRNLLDFHKMQ